MEMNMPWIQEPPLPGPRAMFAAATGAAPAPGSAHWIYAIGGADAGGNPAPTIAYDTQAHSWSPVANLPTPRGRLAAASTPGRVHALAGFDATGTNFVATHEDLPARHRHLVYGAAAADCAFLVGRRCRARRAHLCPRWVERLHPNPGGGGSLRSRERLVGRQSAAADAGERAWRRSQPAGASTPSAAVTTTASLRTVEIYDPATDTWTSGPPLPLPRTGLAAAVGPDGRIYAIGGNDDTATATASVFSHDPATPAAGWATTGPDVERTGPAGGRDRPRRTRLRDRRVQQPDELRARHR